MHSKVRVVVPRTARGLTRGVLREVSWACEVTQGIDSRTAEALAERVGR
jgi:hypothetical protein